MEDEVKKYLDANGRRIIEEWCALQKDTLLKQLIGFIAQEKWELEHGIKKEEEEEEDLEEDLATDRLIGVPESALDEERGREQVGGLSPEPINLSVAQVGSPPHNPSYVSNVNMIIEDVPPPPVLVRQQAVDRSVPEVKTCIGKAL
jgi:hypothetical protein